MTLEAALSGFSARQADVRKQEAEDEARALVSRQERETAELDAASREFAAIMEKARASGARVAGLAKQHDRTTGELESLKLRPATRASTIVRAAIGEIRRADGVTEFGKRIDITLAEVLEMNPGQLMRARDSRRQRGRLNESSEFKDHAVENYLTQARAG